MKKFLVKFNDNYADEFDVSGIIIMLETEVEELKNGVEKYFKEHKVLEVYFGTNESLIWESAKEVLYSLTFNEISDEDEKTLYRLLGESFYMWPGFFPDFLEYFSEV